MYSFLTYTRIPDILGLIDGLIVKILRPVHNEEAFYNYRHKHSLNIQLVSINENACDMFRLIHNFIISIVSGIGS